jgi:hypothetical protein
MVMKRHFSVIMGTVERIRADAVERIRADGYELLAVEGRSTSRVRCA